MKNEIYFLDCLGFAIIRNFHSPQIVDELNSIIDEHLQGEKPVKFKTIGVHDRFLDLMSDPRLLKRLEFFLGSTFRFDHGFGRQQPTWRGDAANLHGGPYSDGYNVYCTNGGKVFTTQIQVCHVLKDQKSEDGGLVFLPGSHKSNAFNNMRSGFGNDPVSGNDLLRAIEEDFDSPYLMCPNLSAGDVVLFTDAIIHGCKPWKANHIRRNLYYSYMTGFISWRKYDPEIQKLARNETEERLLRPPYIGDFQYNGIHLESNEMKTPTIANNDQLLL
jgi:hypothetical protein